MTYEIATNQYAGQTFTSIIRSDGLVIPVDSNNIDYQEYLEWVSAGNTAPAYSESAINDYSPPSDSEVMFTMEVI